jgi:hypothetical protein
MANKNHQLLKYITNQVLQSWEKHEFNKLEIDTLATIR